MLKEQIELDKKFKKLEKSSNFNFDNLSQIPTKQGVFIIYSNNKKTVLHVGRTVRAKNGLKQRLANHKYGQSSFVKQELNGNKNKLKNYYFKFLVEENHRIRALLECYIIGQLCPKHIGLGRRKNSTRPRFK